MRATYATATTRFVFFSTESGGYATRVRSNPIDAIERGDLHDIAHHYVISQVARNRIKTEMKMYECRSWITIITGAIALIIEAISVFILSQNNLKTNPDSCIDIKLQFGFFFFIGHLPYIITMACCITIWFIKGKSHTRHKDTEELCVDVLKPKLSTESFNNLEKLAHAVKNDPNCDFLPELEKIISDYVDICNIEDIGSDVDISDIEDIASDVDISDDEELNLTLPENLELLDEEKLSCLTRCAA